MSKGKIILVVAIGLILGILLYIGPEQYLNLEFIKSQLNGFKAYKDAHPFLTALVFSGTYILVTAASIPGALVLTLCCGAIFGFVSGTAIALVSATIGATISFLVARYLFDDLVQKKAGGPRHPDSGKLPQRRGTVPVFRSPRPSDPVLRD